MNEGVVTLIGVLGTLSGIIFAFLAFRKSEKNSTIDVARETGALLNDIGYIKACTSRMESKLDKVENQYQELLTRVIKLEHCLKEDGFN